MLLWHDSVQSDLSAGRRVNSVSRISNHSEKVPGSSYPPHCRVYGVWSGRYQWGGCITGSVGCTHQGGLSPRMCSPPSLGNHHMPQISKCICHCCSLSKIIRNKELSEIRANWRGRASEPTPARIPTYPMLFFLVPFEQYANKCFSEETHQGRTSLSVTCNLLNVVSCTCVCRFFVHLRENKNPLCPMKSIWKYLKGCSTSPILAELPEYLKVKLTNLYHSPPHGITWKQTTAWPKKKSKREHYMP